MKKLLFLVLALTLVLVFAACSDDALPDENNPVDTGDNNSANNNKDNQEAADSENDYLFSQPYPDSDTLEKEIFEPAIVRYRLFEGLGDIQAEWGTDDFVQVSIPADNESGENIINYYRVNDPNYPTLQSFIDDLRNHFSEEIVQSLLDRGYYIEQDGVFYTGHGARGSNISFRDVQYEIDSQTTDKVIFKATARYIKDSSIFEKTEEEWDAINWEEIEYDIQEFLYTYEKTNDKWVFTTFVLFY